MDIHLLLVRHTESEKNLRESFSSETDAERLTPTGRSEAIRVSKAIGALSESLHVVAQSVYCADSSRAVETSRPIAEILGVPVARCRSLRSIQSMHPGKSEESVFKSDPLFMQGLCLYRAGLYNSYDIPLAEGSESLRVFEARIKEAIDSIIAIRNESLKVVVLHRSPITATLLYFARRLFGYPRNFFGYVELRLGGISWIELSDNGYQIRGVDLCSDELLARTSKTTLG